MNINETTEEKVCLPEGQLYKEIAESYNHEIINNLCRDIGAGHLHLREFLLHTMRTAYDLNNPINRELRSLADQVKNDMLTRS